MPRQDTPSESSGSENQFTMEEEPGFDSDISYEEVIDDDDGNLILNENVSGDENVPERDDAVQVFKKHTGPIFCCHLDPKSNTLAVTGSEDEKAYVWNTTTGDVVLECNNHKDSVISVEFSHDGTYLATGDMSGVVQVWKLSTNSVVWSETIGDISWMKWHPGSAVLMCSAVSHGMYLWKIPSGECKVISAPSVTSECGLFMPDGRRAAIGFDDCSIRVYDLKSCATLATFPSDDGTTICIDAHSDNNVIASGNGKGLVKLHKTQPAKLIAVFDNGRTGTDGESDTGRSCVESVRFSPDPSLQLLVAAYLSGQMLVWDTARQVVRHKLDTECGIVKLIWDRHSMQIYAALLDGSVSVYDARDGSVKSALLGHRDNILDIALSTDGSKLLSASEDSSARIFNLALPNP